MIEVLPDMPNGVTGIRVSGRLRGEELREFKPTIEEMLHTDEIMIVEVIAPDYEGFGPGGLIEDLKLGFSAWMPTGWQRFHHREFLPRLRPVRTRRAPLEALRFDQLLVKAPVRCLRENA